MSCANDVPASPESVCDCEDGQLLEAVDWQVKRALGSYGTKALY